MTSPLCIVLVPYPSYASPNLALFSGILFSHSDKVTITTPVSQPHNFKARWNKNFFGTSKFHKNLEIFFGYISKNHMFNPKQIAADCVQWIKESEGGSKFSSTKEKIHKGYQKNSMWEWRVQFSYPWVRYLNEHPRKFWILLIRSFLIKGLRSFLLNKQKCCCYY